jgi:6-phosphogluconolactonase
MLLKHFPTAEQAAEACCQHLISSLEEVLAAAPRATIALSGGSTPKLLFPKMAQAPLPWDRIHVFWVDERAVPPDHEQSNYRLAETLLIRPAGIPAENVHRVRAELEPREAAARYADEIREFFGLGNQELPSFDVMQRGVGADVHTASLFPGEPLIQDRHGIAEAVYVEKLGQWRITLLPGVLLAAVRTVFLVAGPDKAEAVRTVFEGPYDPIRYPAQLLPTDKTGIAWFTDDAAAVMLKR